MTRFDSRIPTITPEAIEAGMRRGQILRSQAVQSAAAGAWHWLAAHLPVQSHHDHTGPAVHA